MDSWGGISSVQFGISILYTEAVKVRKMAGKGVINKAWVWVCRDK